MSKLSKYYVWYGLASVLYITLIFIIPPDSNTLLRYGLTSIQAKMMSLSLAVPIIGIWFAAFYGFIKFKEYASSVGRSKDGKSLHIISNGLMYLALGLPINTIVNMLLTYYATTQRHNTDIAVIVNNYISLGLVLFAFVTIHKGAQELMKLLKKHEQYTPKEQVVIAIFAVASLVYIYITLTNPARQFPASPTTRAAYYLPDWLLVPTIIIPYLFVWYFGIRSGYFISQYRKRVQGHLYKHALGYLAAGLIAVIVASMFLRFLVSLTTILSSLSLKYLLILIYILILFIAAGYIFIAVGAKKLKRIEEV